MLWRSNKKEYSYEQSWKEILQDKSLDYRYEGWKTIQQAGADWFIALNKDCLEQFTFIIKMKGRMNHHLHFTSFDLFNILIEKRLANFTDWFEDSINYMLEQ